MVSVICLSSQCEKIFMHWEDRVIVRQRQKFTQMYTVITLRVADGKRKPVCHRIVQVW